MHELSICRNIVELAQQHADGCQVQRLQLAVGKLTAVMPDALKFCFEALSQGTLLADARLEIMEIDGLAQCAVCGLDFTMPVSGARCACGATAYRILTGQELKITELELKRELS